MIASPADISSLCKAWDKLPTFYRMHPAFKDVAGVIHELRVEPPPADDKPIIPPEAVFQPFQDANVPAPEYAANTLGSVANWLETRSSTTWATEFGYRGLMATWARDLRIIRTNLAIIGSIAAGSTTANSLPHIAKLARSLEPQPEAIEEIFADDPVKGRDRPVSYVANLADDGYVLAQEIADVPNDVVSEAIRGMRKGEEPPAGAISGIEQSVHAIACLEDVYTHHRSFTKALGAMPDPDGYWLHKMRALDRMMRQACEVLKRRPLYPMLKDADYTRMFSNMPSDEKAVMTEKKADWHTLMDELVSRMNALVSSIRRVPAKNGEWTRLLETNADDMEMLLKQVRTQTQHLPTYRPVAVVRGGSVVPSVQWHTSDVPDHGEWLFAERRMQS